MTTAFACTSPALDFNKSDGTCYGWLCYSHKAHEPYIDLHGDHFPAEELRKAAEDAMALPSSERLVNVDHAGGPRGEVVSIYPLTEDIAKAQGIDTGGTYGLVCSFRPDPALLAEIVKGKKVCLSIEGVALDVETIACAAGEIAATAHKRTMRKVKLGKYQFAVVDAGAHEGAGTAVIKAAIAAARKSAGVTKDVAGAKEWLDKAIARHERHMAGTEDTSEASQQKMMDEMEAARDELGGATAKSIAKATPAATSADYGHQHLISDIDEQTGFTSCEPMSGVPDGGYHSHTWIRTADGVSILMANDHTHTLLDSTATPETPMADPVTASAADLAKSQARASTLASLLLVAATMPPDQAAFAKGLRGEALEQFLALPEAERVAKATPVYKAADGTCYFASDDPRMVALAKSDDAKTAAIAKRDGEIESASFEKSATDLIPHLAGTVSERAIIFKALAGKPLTDAERAKAGEILKGADAAMAMTFRAPGVNGGGAEPNGPEAELEAMAAEIAKTKGVPLHKAMDLATDTPKGKALYAQIYGS